MHVVWAEQWPWSLAMVRRQRRALWEWLLYPAGDVTASQAAGQWDGCVWVCLQCGTRQPTEID